MIAQTITQAKLQESFVSLMMISDSREPLIAKSQKDGEWLDTGEQAQLKLLTKLYGKATDHIKVLLGDDKDGE